MHANTRKSGPAMGTERLALFEMCKELLATFETDQFSVAEAYTGMMY